VGRLIRGVLLDAFGTLLELEPPAPALQQALGARGIEVSFAAAEQAMAAEISFYRDHLMSGGDRRGLVALRRRCAETLAAALPAEAGRALAPGDLEDVLLQSLRFAPFAEVPEALRALRAEGLRLVVVSNWDCSLHDVQAATGLSPQLHAVVASAEVQSAKPDGAIFARALALAGVPASAALHVGDRLDEDVAGARAAGIEPVLIVRDGRRRSPPADVRVITALDELVAAGS